MSVVVVVAVVVVVVYGVVVLNLISHTNKSKTISTARTCRSRNIKSRTFVSAT